MTVTTIDYLIIRTCIVITAVIAHPVTRVINDFASLIAFWESNSNELLLPVDAKRASDDYYERQK